MRVWGRVVLGLTGLVTVLAVGLWLALPALVAPTRQPPPAGQVPSGAISAALSPAPDHLVALRLTAALGSDLVNEALAPSSNAGGSDLLSAAGVRFTPGELTLELFGQLPAGLPVPGWSADPFELDVRVQPSLPSPGVLTARVVSVRVGILPLSTFIPPARLLAWAFRRLPTMPAGLTRDGAVLHLNLAALPPITFPGTPGLSVRVNPVTLLVSSTALRVNAAVAATYEADPAQVTTLLQQSFAQGATVPLPALAFGQGSVAVSLPSLQGAAETFRLAPSIPQPDVLQLGIDGPGAGPPPSPLLLAAWLDAALGREPPWLVVTPHALRIDFGNAGPLRVPGFGAVAVMPTGVQVTPAQLQVQFGIAPVPDQAAPPTPSASGTSPFHAQPSTQVPSAAGAFSANG